MNHILKSNLTVIEKRWPHIKKLIDHAKLDSLDVQVERNTLLVNNIQLTSNYNRISEAKIQSSLIPLDAETAFVYGVGLGDLILEILQRKNIKNIYVCSLNLDLFLHVLNVIDHTEWLNDKRVSILLVSQIKDVYHPFAVIPSELFLIEDSSAQLRDRLVLELDQDYISQDHDFNNKQAIGEIENNIKFIKQDADITELLQSVSGRIYIAAAGPTLSEHISWIKQKKSVEDIFIIALDAAVKPLMKYNIIPNIVVSIDARSSQVFKDVDLGIFTNTPLVYFPRLDGNFLSNWPGKRYCSYSKGDLYVEVSKKHPKVKLFSAGSVIHSATDLAVLMGANEVVFLGADFGFPENKTYASGQEYQYTEQFLSSSHWVLNGTGEKITTMLNYRGYLRDLERYIQSKPNVKFINGSLKGARIEGTTLL
jgi:hypothetical protein